jgi:hypothetical protein
MTSPLIALGVVAAFLWPEKWDMWPELKAPGEFIVGEWRGHALFQDAKFERCEMGIARGNWRLLVGIDRENSPTIGFGHRNIQFDRKKEFTATLHIGEGPPVSVVMNRLRRKGGIGPIRGTLPNEAAQRLTQARHFRVTMGEIFADLELGAIRRAWPELQRCAVTRGSR